MLKITEFARGWGSYHSAVLSCIIGLTVRCCSVNNYKQDQDCKMTDSKHYLLEGSDESTVSRSIVI